VRKVKGVSFNYLQFLWGNYALIRKAQAEGDIPKALKLAATLVDYLPSALKTEFQKRADQILESMNIISAGNIKQLQDIPDIFLRRAAKIRILNNYSYLALRSFVNDMSTELQKRGYMESVDFADEGFGHTWQEHQRAKREKRL
jgi:hypothetical protein